MRPTAVRQSQLRAPLNAILGTEASVRVIRALSVATVPLSRREVAREAELHMSGIARVMEHLENSGVVESIGRGRSQPVRLRDKHPLTEPIRQLFQAELARARDVEDRILSAVQSVPHHPDAVWIEKGDTNNASSNDDSIVVGALAAQGGNEQWAHHVRHLFLEIQTKYDVAIELRVRWRADILTAGAAARDSLRNVRPLIGPPPLDLLGLSESSATQRDPNEFSSHATHDADALAYATAIAAKLRTNPDLVGEALRFIDQRSHTASASERLELREWHDILSTYSPGRLRRFLVSESQRARRLRQSLPFVTALSSEERNRVRARPRGEPT